MVVISGGNKEIGAHVKREFGNLISHRYFFFDRQQPQTRNFFSKKIYVFLHTCATWYELPSNISSAHKNTIKVRSLHVFSGFFSETKIKRFPLNVLFLLPYVFVPHFMSFSLYMFLYLLHCIIKYFFKFNCCLFGFLKKYLTSKSIFFLFVLFFSCLRFF